MSLKLSRRAQRVNVSPNAASKARATELRAEGCDVLDLTTGEPDFDTPSHIKAAACGAIEAGSTKYTATGGMKELRAAVVNKLLRENYLNYQHNQTFIANGAKQVIFNAFAATLDDGDEVVIPTPYWPTFPDAVRFNGGEPVLVKCGYDQGCKIKPEQLAAAIGPKTKWLVLNNPGNPSGALYTCVELSALAEVLRKTPHVWLMLDELYEHIRFDGSLSKSLLNVAPDLVERSLFVGGVSKTYAMTGWRIGYGAGPAALVKAMTVVQSQSTSGASSISQAAAVAALNGGLAFLPDQVATYKSRRDVFVSKLAEVADLQVLVPDGGFFVFVCCAKLIGLVRPDGERIRSDDDLIEWLLENGVAAISGSAYGLSPWLRFSIATDSKAVAEAANRVVRACELLKEGKE
ncbi:MULTISPECIES: aminotransferase class I/II-fold pyridoxal phosphate-dependent enzyme [unclassified Pseudomonas]|uniref:aminotransferase class I/II-fold pyridoxal phosphate-dependent enzyme n=1 Tax=unclassified Pseudomonas TaxID=196821 RepID=UPI003825A533